MTLEEFRLSMSKHPLWWAVMHDTKPKFAYKNSATAAACPVLNAFAGRLTKWNAPRQISNGICLKIEWKSMKKSLTSDMSLKLLTPSVSSLLAGPHPSVFCARTGGSQWISASTRQMSAVGRVDGTVVFVNALRGSVHIHAQGHSMYDVFSYSSLWSVVFWYHFQFPGLVQVRVKGSHSPHSTTLRASRELWDRRNGCPASFCWASYLKWGKASSPITQMISSDLKTSPSDVKIQVLSMGWTLGWILVDIYNKINQINTSIDSKILQVIAVRCDWKRTPAVTVSLHMHLYSVHVLIYGHFLQ